MLNRNSLRVLSAKNFLTLQQSYATSIEPKGYNEIPGPEPYPIIGNLLNAKPFGDFDILSFRDFLDQLHAKYGDIVKWSNPEFNPKNWIRPNRTLFLFNPNHIKEVFKADGSTPARPQLEPLIKLHKKIGISSALINR